MASIEHASAVPEYSNARRARLVDAARVGFTTLACLMAVTILGTSADVLAVYNKTHVGQSFQLALWPFDFNPGPTISLVAGSAVVVVSSLASLVASRARSLRSKALPHTVVVTLSPVLGLIAALVSVSFFYAINASTTTETPQSWSCRWSQLSMQSPPHFQSLCRESKSALYLMIAMIPMQLIILGVTAFEFMEEKKKKTSVAITAEKGSPAMS